MHKYKGHLLNSSFIRILLIQFLLVAVLGSLFTLFFSNKIAYKYTEKSHESEQKHISELNKAFQDNIKKTEKNVVFFARLLSSLQGDYTLLQKNGNSGIFKPYSGEYVDYFSLEGKCLSCSENSSEQKIWENTDNGPWIHSNDFSGYIIKEPVFANNKEIGFLKAKISLERLIPAFSKKSKLNYVIYDKKGKLIYASGFLATNSTQHYIDLAEQVQNKNGYLEDSLTHTHIFYLKENSYSLLFLHPDSVADEFKRFLYLSNSAIVFTILLCFIFIAVLFYYHLLRPIAKVNKKIQKISDQNWNGAIHQGTKFKELQELFRLLNDQIQLIHRQRLEQNEHRKYLENEVLKKIEELEGANKRLQAISRTDELTGLPNRRDIKEKISFEISRAQRFQSSFSLLLIDIDYFKKINDTYGHLAGDFVLKKFADITRNLLRKYDHAARFGGEEFLLVLPETNETSAKIVAERFRAYIESYPFVYNNQQIHVTISIGISLFDPKIGLEDSLLLADKALYHSKENGRNTITLWSEELRKN